MKCAKSRNSKNAARASGSLGTTPGWRSASSATARGDAEPTWWTCSSALGSPAMNVDRSVMPSPSQHQVAADRSGQDSQEQQGRQHRLLGDHPGARHSQDSDHPGDDEQPGLGPGTICLSGEQREPDCEDHRGRQHQGGHHPLLDPLDLHEAIVPVPCRHRRVGHPPPQLPCCTAASIWLTIVVTALTGSSLPLMNTVGVPVMWALSIARWAAPKNVVSWLFMASRTAALSPPACLTQAAICPSVTAPELCS